MTASTLRTYTCKDLAQMARKEGVAGWHGMRKDELVSALVRVGRRRRSSKSQASAGRDADKRGPTKTNGTRPVTKAAPRRARPSRLIGVQQKLALQKNLASGPAETTNKRDRLVVMVRDPYWLHAYWELTPQSVERARCALSQHWHTAKPVLRVHRVQEDGGSKLEKIVEVHGGVCNWYVDVKEPPRSYRLEIGYDTPGSPFFCLARSNTVSTPAPGAAELVDRNWTDVAENADQIFAMSGGYSPNGASVELQELLEERLRRRLGRPSETRYGNGAATEARGDELRLAIDAELVVFGSTDRHTHVTIQGEPVQVNADGGFAIKMHLPDRRQVIPIVASSSDGVDQKTVVLGVERNTKMLDPKTGDRPS